MAPSSPCLRAVRTPWAPPLQLRRQRAAQPGGRRRQLLAHPVWRRAVGRCGAWQPPQHCCAAPGCCQALCPLVSAALVRLGSDPFGDVPLPACAAPAPATRPAPTLPPTPPFLRRRVRGRCPRLGSSRCRCIRSWSGWWTSFSGGAKPGAKQVWGPAWPACPAWQPLNHACIMIACVSLGSCDAFPLAAGVKPEWRRSDDPAPSIFGGVRALLLTLQPAAN